MGGILKRFDAPIRCTIYIKGRRMESALECCGFLLNILSLQNLSSLKKAIVIGAGIGGIAASIRLQSKGYQVAVFEANSYRQFKLNTLSRLNKSMCFLRCLSIMRDGKHHCCVQIQACYHAE